jgi:hypothetical protein
MREREREREREGERGRERERKRGGKTYMHNYREYVSDWEKWTGTRHANKA